FLKEAASLASALQAGDVLVANHAPGEFIDQLSKDPNIYMSSVAGMNWYGLEMNYQQKPLDNPKVRMAIAKALDRDELVQKAVFDGSVVDPDPDESIWNFFYSKGPWNGFHYSNPKADELLVAQRAEVDQEKRAQLLWQLEDMLNAEAAVGWGYHRKDTVAFQK